jgi:hypothetical protein
MASKVKFSTCKPGADRVHHVSEDDVRIVLGRLPFEAKHRLRAVHFNDRGRGGRFFGYVTRGRREITLCALPPRMTLGRAILRGQRPEVYGALPGRKWPVLAVRRLVLYHVFLHELGHLQLVDEQARSNRLKFADEKLAEEFAIEWCAKLWSERFDHPDAVHNPPTPAEIEALCRKTFA